MMAITAARSVRSGRPRNTVGSTRPEYLRPFHVGHVGTADAAKPGCHPAANWRLSQLVGAFQGQLSRPPPTTEAGERYLYREKTTAAAQLAACPSKSALSASGGSVGPSNSRA